MSNYQINVTVETKTVEVELGSYQVDVTVLSGSLATTWGLITGTLSDQTDLQAALDAKSDEADFLAHTGDSTIHFTEASIDHENIQNIGVNTHAQIDSHISNVSNPHNVLATQISDFDTEVSNNSDVSANTSKRHDAATVLDSSTIDFSITGQQISGSVIQSALDHANIIVGDNNSDHDGRYYTETEIDNNFVPYTGANSNVDLGSYDITTTGKGTFATLNTGQGDNELYAMNQDVETSDSPTFLGLTLSSFNSAGFVKNNASGVLSGGNSIDISADTNLAVSDPITLTDDTIGLGYNATNLKITSNQLNTIQDIATSSTPTFGGMTLNGTLNSYSIIPQTDSSYDLGSSLKYFDKAYFDNLYVSNQSNFGYSALTRFYDFNGVVYPSTSGNIATYKQTASLSSMNGVAPESWAGTEFTSYGGIWESDDVYLAVNNFGLGAYYIGELFQFQTGETGNVDEFTIYWEGKISEVTYQVYIWNFDTSSWDVQGSTKSNTDNEGFSYTITSSPNNYFEDGKFYLLVCSITAVSGLYTLQTNYLSLSVTTAEGILEFNNSDFNDQLSITKNSPKALLVQSEDNDEILKIDTIKGITQFGNAKSTGNLFVDKDSWIKGKLGIGSFGEPSGNVFKIDERGFDIFSVTGNTANSVYLSLYPSDSAGNEKLCGNSYFTNPDERGVYAHGDKVINIYSAVQSGFYGHQSGNSNISSIGFYGIGHNNFGYLNVGNFIAKEIIAGYFKPVETLGAALTEAIDAGFGCYIENADSGYVTLPKQILSYIKKPTTATENFQQYLVGNGAGTGIWIGGDLTFEELVSSSANSIFNAAVNWTGTGWSRDATNQYFKHTPGTTNSAVLSYTRLTSGSILNGKKYHIDFAIKDRTAGYLTPNFSGTDFFLNATATITIASPAVITCTSHGLKAGDTVAFTTTGALPTGITASTPYYVISSGLTANTFRISETSGGSAINTSGSQSGTHTVRKVFADNGTYVEFITATANNRSIYFTPSSDFDGALDDFYIHAVTGFYHSRIYNSANSVLDFAIDVSGTEASQIQLTDGILQPTTDNDIDLGTSSLEFKDLYIDGVAYLDQANIGDGTNEARFSTSGVLTLLGNARHQVRLQTPVSNFKGSGVNPATEVEYGLNGAYEFSKTVDESISLAIAVPLDIDRSVAPKFTIGWSSPASSGTCVWQIEVLYRSEDEDWSSTTPDDTIELEASPSTTADGTKLASFTLPVLSSIDAGIIVKLTRLASDGDDDMDDVAYVFGGALDYTANKLGQSL